MTRNLNKKKFLHFTGKTENEINKKLCHKFFNQKMLFSNKSERKSFVYESIFAHNMPDYHIVIHVNFTKHETLFRQLPSIHCIVIKFTI